MRKISAIILSLILIMSTLAVLAIPASAEDAKVEIGKVAADYKPAEGAVKVEKIEDITDLAGNYYLANDLTISATVATAFTGTIDGCGHTITVSAPVFAEFGGTIKNLTIKGAVSADSGDLAALAIKVVGGPVTISNIANEATVTHNGAEKTDACVGGLIGLIANDKTVEKNSVTIENCINKADVKGPEATGGLVGEAQRAPVEGATGVVIKNCINNNKVESISTDSGTASGGMIGYNGNGYITITGCVNNGEIVSAYRAGGMEGDARKGVHIFDSINRGNVKAPVQAAGMVAYACDKDTVADSFVVENCVNYGVVDAYVEGATSGDAGAVAGYIGANKAKAIVYKATGCINYGEIKGGNRVGGMVGYVYAGSNRYVELVNCATFGTVKAGSWGSEFVGYTNSKNTKIENSIGAAKLEKLAVKKDGTDVETRLCLVGVSSAAVKEMKIINVILCDEGATEWFTYASDEANAANRIALVDALKADFVEGMKIERKEAEYIASGAFAADYNEKAGKKVFYQEVGKDSLPTITPVVKIDKDGKEVIVNDVVKGEDGKISNPTYVPGGNTPTPIPTATGDSTVIMMAVFALAMVAGLALVFVPKKKEN